jgi:hypothetical protein
MSNSAVFILIANDGRADQMIMATALLLARIDDIRALRAAEGEVDINPTLADIERTHVLFMNATFKPFAAFGFEYQKVSPTGTVSWGTTGVKYSIPQSGDFFSDMGIMFDVAAATYGGANTTTSAELISSSGELVASSDATEDPYIRYADYPGERAVVKAKFSVNSNALHEYDHFVSANWRKFHLAPGDANAYKRLVGQEVAMPGAGPTQAVDTTFITNGNFATTEHRTEVKILSGLQTPKTSQPASIFWHRCGFWFNMDKRLMVPSVAIPYGQRFVEIDFAAQNMMMRVVGGVSDAQALGATADDTIHYSRLFSSVVTTGGGWDADHLARLTAVDMFDTTSLSTAATEVITGGGINSANLYVNNIYVLPDIHDIYIHRIGFNLIRVHRTQSTSITASSTPSQQLHNLKWPIEGIYFGCQADAVKNDLDLWWRMGNPDHELGTLASISGQGDAADTIAAVALPYSFITQGTRTMTAISISLHGTKLYDAYNASFFSDYMPAVYGGCNVTSSDDQNSHAVFFGLYPGMYQPNGHINISRARELYLDFTQSAVAGTLIVIADAINFLLISDGNAILRYTT